MPQRIAEGTPKCIGDGHVGQPALGNDERREEVGQGRPSGGEDEPDCRCPHPCVYPQLHDLLRIVLISSEIIRSSSQCNRTARLRVEQLVRYDLSEDVTNGLSHCLKGVHHLADNETQPYDRTAHRDEIIPTQRNVFKYLQRHTAVTA